MQITIGDYFTRQFTKIKQYIDGTAIQENLDETELWDAFIDIVKREKHWTTQIESPEGIESKIPAYLLGMIRFAKQDVRGKITKKLKKQEKYGVSFVSYESGFDEVTGRNKFEPAKIQNDDEFELPESFIKSIKRSLCHGRRLTEETINYAATIGFDKLEFIKLIEGYYYSNK